MENSHHHHHHSTSDLSGKKLWMVVLFNLIITIVEIIGGIFSGSLSLISDSIHNLSDTISLFISGIAISFSKKKATTKFTFGYKRGEILAAFFNSTTLIIISGYLVFSGIKRFFYPETISGELMTIVAVVGLIGNVASVFFLRKSSKENLNMKTAYLHLLSDSLSSVAVILGGIAILKWKIYWIDPLLTILIALYIFKETISSFMTSFKIIMQSVPEGIDIVKIKEDIEKIEKVKNIHHIHIWTLDEDQIMFEGHILLDKQITIEELDKILKQIKSLLEEKHHIHHSTIQPEYISQDNPKEILH